jgi:DNA-3-methyladenine glycosylase II
MKKDRVMKRLIPQFGEASLQSRGDAFTTLGAQHCGAADLGQGRADRVGPFRSVAAQNDARAMCSSSRWTTCAPQACRARKVEYLVDLALHFDNGAVHVEEMV